MMNVDKLLCTNEYIEETSDRLQALEDSIFKLNTQIQFKDQWGNLVSSVSFGEAALVNFLEEGTEKSESQIIMAFKDAKSALDSIKDTGFVSKELMRLEHTVNDVLSTYERY